MTRLDGMRIFLYRTDVDSDMVSGKYEVPWAETVVEKDGKSCGFAAPTRTYKGEETPPDMPK
ncbi:unnamed protein product [Bathycoccus prasinos]